MSTCILCDSKKLRQIVTFDHKSYLHCESCDLIFLAPEQRLPLPDEKTRYLEHNNNPQEESYQKYLKKTWSQVEPFLRLTKNLNILDFGCGPTKGLESVFREDIGKTVTSYDPIFFAASEDLKPEYFDVIFCSESIEHAYEPKDFLSTLTGCLKEEGHIVGRTAFHPGLLQLEDWWYRKDATHVCFYSDKVFQWVARTYSLELLKIHSPYFVLNKR